MSPFHEMIFLNDKSFLLQDIKLTSSLFRRYWWERLINNRPKISDTQNNTFVKKMVSGNVQKTG